MLAPTMLPSDRACASKLPLTTLALVMASSGGNTAGALLSKATHSGTLKSDLLPAASTARTMKPRVPLAYGAPVWV